MGKKLKDVHFPEPLFEILASGGLGLPQDTEVDQKNADNVVDKGLKSVKEKPKKENKNTLAEDNPAHLSSVQEKRLEAATIVFFGTPEAREHISQFAGKVLQQKFEESQELFADKTKALLESKQKEVDEVDEDENSGAGAFMVDFYFKLQHFWNKMRFIINIIKIAKKYYGIFNKLMAMRGKSWKDLLTNPNKGDYQAVAKEVIAPMIGESVAAVGVYVVNGMVIGLAKLFTMKFRRMVKIYVNQIHKFIKDRVKAWIKRMILSSVLNVIPGLGQAAWIAVNITLTIADFAISAYALISDIDRELKKAGREMYSMGLTRSPSLPKSDLSSLKVTPADNTAAMALAQLRDIDVSTQMGQQEAVRLYNEKVNWKKFGKGSSIGFKSPTDVNMRFKYPSLKNYKLWMAEFRNVVAYLYQYVFSGQQGIFSENRIGELGNSLTLRLDNISDKLSFRLKKQEEGETQGLTRRVFTVGGKSVESKEAEEYITATAEKEQMNALLYAALDKKRNDAIQNNQETNDKGLTEKQIEERNKIFLTEGEVQQILSKPENQKYRKYWLSEKKEVKLGSGVSASYAYYDIQSGNQTLADISEDEAKMGSANTSYWSKTGTKVELIGLGEDTSQTVVITDKKLFGSLGERYAEFWNERNGNQFIATWPLYGFIYGKLDMNGANKNLFASLTKSYNAAVAQMNHYNKKFKEAQEDLDSWLGHISDYAFKWGDDYKKVREAKTKRANNLSAIYMEKKRKVAELDELKKNLTAKDKSFDSKDVELLLLRENKLRILEQNYLLMYTLGVDPASNAEVAEKYLKTGKDEEGNEVKLNRYDSVAASIKRSINVPKG